MFVLMSSVTINSVPSGAEVMVDGVSVGTTPVSIDVVSVDLQEFRATCLTEEEVSCEWDVLKVWLEDHRISEVWWDMTTTERRSVAVNAIQNTCYTICDYWSLGFDCCGGSDDVRYSAVCYHNMMIRYLKFQSEDDIVPYEVGPDSCYWDNDVLGEWACFHPSSCYKLPGHYISRLSYGGDIGHAMASIQVDEDMTSLDSWIIFQYQDIDIKSGCFHIPSGSDIRILKLDSLGCNMYDEGPTMGCRGTVVAEFTDV